MFNTIIHIILSHYPSAEAIYVYGSYAKGLETPQSDIDICVLMPPTLGLHRHDFALNDELSETIGKQVHAVFCAMKNEWCLKEIYNASQDKAIQELSVSEPLITKYLKRLFAW